MSENNDYENEMLNLLMSLDDSLLNTKKIKKILDEKFGKLVIGMNVLKKMLIEKGILDEEDFKKRTNEELKKYKEKIKGFLNENENK